MVTWFGDDLRAGECSVRPKVTHHTTDGFSQDWVVSGLTRPEAELVSTNEGGAAYGGTPSDRSVLDAIAEIKARGLKVTLCPFVMMDIPSGNGRANPYTGAADQPAYPWRGRITCDPAPGVPGSADKTAAARSQVQAFSGAAQAGDFAAGGDTVLFAGEAEDWGYRRLVLHYAALAAAAGGVDAFLLGSEMRGLTTLRDGAGAFPFVEQLCDLASEVRGIVGGATKITYGADWSEYFGHQPTDGTGDVFFHLDPLWAHAEIDAIGIDCYMPLLDASRIYLWAWDARPFPAFPTRTDIWSDGNNWLLGHWLNGRMNGVAVAELINAVLSDHGIEPADVAGVQGAVTGYLIADPTTARGALAPVVELFGLTAARENDRLVFSTEEASGGSPLEIGEFAVIDDRAMRTRTRAAEHDLPAEAVLSFADPIRDFQAGTARALLSAAPHRGQSQINFPGAIEAGMADALASDRMRRRWTARDQISFAVEQTRIDLVPGKVVRVSDEEGAGDYLITSVDAGAAREISGRRMRTVPPSPWKTHLLSPAKVRTPRAGPPLALFLDLPMLHGASAPEEQLRLALRAKPWAPHAVYASPASSGFERRGLAMQEATVGTLVQPLDAGFEGRFDNVRSIVVELLHGELSSVPDIQLLNGANLAAIRSANGEWEVLQFGQAEEVEASVWRLSRLLRGQYGTRPAMLAGADAGALFVMLDQAVAPAGLKAQEIGLLLNWRVGPLGCDFAGPAFAAETVAGGERARRPLSPVHLAAERQGDGSLTVSWIRRGRIDADRGIAGSVPVGEESEAYAVEVAAEAGPSVRAVRVSSPEWTYAAAEIAADFPDLPAAIDITVRQLGSADLRGDASVLRFQLT